MPIDEFIINIYLMVEQYYKIVVTKLSYAEETVQVNLVN